MKSNDFIKKYGWGVAIKLSNEMTGITQDIANCVASWGQSEWDCLKRLVESYGIVNKTFKGLDDAKWWYECCWDCDSVAYVDIGRIKQAIADVESCL